MSLPLRSFDSFIARVGVPVILQRRSGSGPNAELFTVELRAFVDSTSIGTVSVGSETMPFGVTRCHVSREELERAGFPSAPRAGDVVMLDDRKLFVNGVRVVSYAGRPVRYVLEIREDQV